MGSGEPEKSGIEDFFDYQHQEKNGGQCTDGEKVAAAVGMGGGVAAPGAAFGLKY